MKEFNELTDREKDMLFLEGQLQDAIKSQKKIADDFETYKVNSVAAIKELAISAGIWEQMELIEKDIELRKEKDQKTLNTIANDMEQIKAIRRFLESRQLASKEAEEKPHQEKKL